MTNKPTINQELILCRLADGWAIWQECAVPEQWKGTPGICAMRGDDKAINHRTIAALLSHGWVTKDESGYLEITKYGMIAAGI